MELQTVRCTQCGANFEFESVSDQYVQGTCIACGSVFLVEQAVRFAGIDDKKAQKIRDLREGLKNASDNEQLDLMKQRAADILALIPDDFVSNFCLEFVHKLEGDPRKYEALLASGAPCLQEEAEFCLKLALENYEGRNKDSIIRFIENHFTASAKSLYMTKLNDIDVNWNRKEADYQRIPRDVFICYSSKDSAVCERFYHQLEEKGIKCWAAFNNLRPNTINYKSDIEYAISNAKVIVVISSNNSMYSSDVQWELQTAENHTKQLVEFKIDEAKHTDFFKHHFDGNQWVNGCGLKDKQYIQLMKRVTAILWGGDTKQKVAPVQPAKANSSENKVDPQKPVVDAKAEKEKNKQDKKAEKLKKKQEKLQQKDLNKRKKHALKYHSLVKSHRNRIGKSLAGITVFLYLLLLTWSLIVCVSVPANMFTGTAISTKYIYRNTPVLRDVANEMSSFYGMVNDEIPSVQHVTKALNNTYNTIYDIWPIKATTSVFQLQKFCALSTVMAFAIVLISIPFTALSIRRATGWAQFLHFVGTVLYTLMLVYPRMMTEDASRNLEEMFVLGFTYLWMPIFTIILLTIIRRIATRRINHLKRISEEAAKNLR